MGFPHSHSSSPASPKVGEEQEKDRKHPSPARDPASSGRNRRVFVLVGLASIPATRIAHPAMTPDAPDNLRLNQRLINLRNDFTREVDAAELLLDSATATYDRLHRAALKLRSVRRSLTVHRELCDEQARAATQAMLDMAHAVLERVEVTSLTAAESPTERCPPFTLRWSRAYQLPLFATIITKAALGGGSAFLAPYLPLHTRAALFVLVQPLDRKSVV